MRRTRMLSLFAAIVFTFCFAETGLAGETKTAITSADANSMQTQSSGFRRINLAETHGHDLKVMTEWPADAVTSERGGLVDGRPDVLKVLAVFERRTGDHRLIEKARYKLAGMSESRLRLAVSLSERLADNGSRAENKIAFLLLTTLIVFS